MAIRMDTHVIAAVGPPGWPRALWLVGTILLVAMLAHIAALAITGGPVTGPVSLRKPITFAETGWLTAWSVALIQPTLRMRAWQRHVVGASVLLFVIGETAIIGFQAWRGVPSHYYFSTPLDVALMRGGAAGTAAIFLIGIIILLGAALRSGDRPASQRLGVCAGIIVLLVGCAVGFVMISNNSGVYQGSVGSGFANRASTYMGPSPMTIGPEYLLLRPSTDGGDLVLLLRYRGSWLGPARRTRRTLGALGDDADPSVARHRGGGRRRGSRHGHPARPSIPSTPAGPAPPTRAGSPRRLHRRAARCRRQRRGGDAPATPSAE